MANTPHLPTWRLQRERRPLVRLFTHYVSFFDLPTFLLLALLRFWVSRRGSPERDDCRKALVTSRLTHGHSYHGPGPERDDCRKALVTQAPSALRPYLP
jgi:hypothetical protein